MDVGVLLNRLVRADHGNYRCLWLFVFHRLEGFTQDALHEPDCGRHLVFERLDVIYRFSAQVDIFSRYIID